MSVFDLDKKITATFLKANGFSKAKWGAPDIHVVKSKSNKYGRPVYKWKAEHMMYEKIFEDELYYIYYFPKKFTGYVNIQRNKIQNHAGYIYAAHMFRNEEFILKVETESDFIMAVDRIKKLFKDYRVGI